MKSAVEWLVANLDIDLVDSDWYIEKAKEMEKQQIIDARQDGYDCTYAEYGETPKCYLDGSSEQYYNKTFKDKL